MNNQNLPTERHPFEPYNVDKCEYLIIGSFPPKRLTKKIKENIKQLKLDDTYKDIAKKGEDIDFYYGSKENLFWKIIEKVFNKELPTKEDRISFLNKNNIGITDIAEEVARKQKDGKINSSDKGLIITEFRNFTGIEDNKKIKKIFTTSVDVTAKIKEVKLLPTSLQEKIITLISPSPSASRPIGKRDDYKEYKKTCKEKKCTFDFRIKKYKEAFKKVGLLP